MKIAYVILAHKLPKQLTRLVHKLNAGDVSFFIHVDKKTDNQIFEEIRASLNAFNNVYFMERRVCNWGEFNAVAITLNIMYVILRSDIRYDYVILLTGQDYPIKSNKQIQKVLNASGGQSFIEFFPLPSEHWENENGGLDRLYYWHLNFLGRRIAFMKEKQLRFRILNLLPLRLNNIFSFRRKLPHKFAIFGGSAYWCLTRECVEYIGNLVQSDRTYINFFKFTSLPDETFFQTILLNSPLKNSLVNNNLRHIMWSKSSHPEILQKQHFDQFMNSDKLFARKFDMTIDADVLDMIDQVLCDFN